MNRSSLLPQGSSAVCLPALLSCTPPEQCRNFLPRHLLGIDCRVLYLPRSRSSVFMPVFCSRPNSTRRMVRASVTSTPDNVESSYSRKQKARLRTLQGYLRRCGKIKKALFGKGDEPSPLTLSCSSVRFTSPGTRPVCFEDKIAHTDCWSNLDEALPLLRFKSSPCAASSAPASKTSSQQDCRSTDMTQSC